MNRLLMETEPRVLVMLMVSATLLVIATLGSYVIWPEFRDFRKSMDTLSVLREVTSRGDDLVVGLSRPVIHLARSSRLSESPSIGGSTPGVAGSTTAPRRRKSPRI